MSWDGTPPDSYWDPPDDPPLVECPDCDGEGVIEQEEELEYGTVIVRMVKCEPCDGDGERYMTDEEVRDAAAEAQIERAEARRDGDL